MSGSAIVAWGTPDAYLTMTPKKAHAIYPANVCQLCINKIIYIVNKYISIYIYTYIHS